MTTRYPLVLNGTSIQELQSSDSLVLPSALATGSGGTGLTSFTANGVVYASSTSALATGSALTFDGTNFATTGIANIGNGARIQGSGSLTGTGVGAEIFASGGVTYYTSYDRTGSAYSPIQYYSGTYQAWNIGGEKMRLTSAGYLGINNNNPATNLSIGSSAGSGSNGLGIYLARGATTNFLEAYDGTKTFIAGTDSSNSYVKVGSLSNHPVAIVQQNGNAIYIDTSKNVGIGTTSPGRAIELYSSQPAFKFNNGTYNWTLGTGAFIDGSDSFNIYSGTLGNVALRVDGSGNLLVGTTTSQATLTASRTSAGAALYASQDCPTNYTTAAIYQTAGGGNGGQNIGLVVGIQAQNDADRVITAQFWNSGSPVDRFYVQKSGSTYNSTGVYGTISDGTLKQDIVDATSQWDDIKNIKFRKYRLIADVKADPNAPHLLGVVAQELEESNMHGLVETPTQVDGTQLKKQVKLSIMYMKGMKALQEAIARIENLETELNALKQKVGI